MVLAALAAVFLVSAPATAAQIMDKEACRQGVRDVRDTLESGESPKPGGKTWAEVVKILEVTTSLCERGNFRDAESLLELARTMTASE
jgi:hypothetical protein